MQNTIFIKTPLTTLPYKDGTYYIEFTDGVNTYKEVCEFKNGEFQNFDPTENNDGNFWLCPILESDYSVKDLFKILIEHFIEKSAIQ